MTIGIRPIIALSMGDAAGIGPEVIAKALCEEEIYRLCRPLVIGNQITMARAVKLAPQALQINSVAQASQVVGDFGTVDLLDLHNLDGNTVIQGRVSPECGRAAMEYIQKGAELALSGEVAALCTAPINKEATLLAGYEGLGHLEFLGKLTKSPEYATMLVTDNLRVVHLTTHHSLKVACTLVTKERILARLKLTSESFNKWGFEKVRIAVAALNPHASEDGMFGSEESEQITPAIKAAQALGINAVGPIPADSVFNRAINGEFDVVLAMYHDQGHIPIKVHGFELSVSVALGLPFLRTSVDHGTAFDIAGKGIAGAASMVEAIKTAVYLSQGHGLQAT